VIALKLGKLRNFLYKLLFIIKIIWLCFCSQGEAKVLFSGNKQTIKKEVQGSFIMRIK